jgi:hypothetical protein
MAALSEWLQIMLGEIARKRDDQERARAEETQRAAEAAHRPAEPRSGAVSSTPELRVVGRR